MVIEFGVNFNADNNWDNEGPFMLICICYNFFFTLITLLMDTYRENTLSNKIQALTKSMDIEIWAASTWNKLFRGLPKLTKKRFLFSISIFKK